MIRAILANHVSWSPNILKSSLLPLLLVLAVHIVAKLLTGIMDCVLRNFNNKLAGGALVF
jgi:membrane protein required for colicin V production